MRAPTYHVRGEADVQLLVSGAWAGFAPPVITGSAQIKNASAQLTGLRAPLRIASAEMELTPTIAALRKMTASLGQAGPSFSGSIQIPRGCGHPEECIADVDLRTAELNPDSLAPLLASDAHAQWYRFFASQKAEQPSLLMRARANGHVAIDRLCTATLEATNVNAEIAHLLGGTQLGEWRADFTGTAPKYSGQGTIMRAAMSRLPATGVLPCCSGTVNLTYSAHFTGKSRAELLESATAEASFTWNNGALNRFSFPFEAKANHPAGIAAGSPLRFSKFSGTAELRDGAVQLTRSKIVSAGGIYQVSGTLTFDRHLVMTFASTSQRYIVGGTLDEPLIAMEAQRAASRAVPTPPAPAASPSPAPSAALVKAGPGAN
jgi:hypothetical protein